MLVLGQHINIILFRNDGCIVACKNDDIVMMTNKKLSFADCKYLKNFVETCGDKKARTEVLNIQFSRRQQLSKEEKFSNHRQRSQKAAFRSSSGLSGLILFLFADHFRATLYIINGGMRLDDDDQSHLCNMNSYDFFLLDVVIRNSFLNKTLCRNMLIT